MRWTASFLGVGCVLSVALLAACATGGRGPSDEELILQQLDAFVNDLLAGNADTILGYVSDDFSHDQVPNKDALAGYIQEGKDSGRVAQIPQMAEEHGAEIILDEAEVIVDGDTATVYPIEARADVGSVTVEMQFKKDPDGVWRILTLYIEGV